MDDIVNLRLARKRKARSERERAADENRALHGRTKADRGTAERVLKLREAHRRERPTPGGEDETGRS